MCAGQQPDARRGQCQRRSRGAAGCEDLPLGGARFLSRQAYGLVHASQREDEVARAHRRAARLHGLLGSPRRSAFAGTPVKPKWMRWPTYERLAAELQEIDAGLEEAMERTAARLLA